MDKLKIIRPFEKKYFFLLANTDSNMIKIRTKDKAIIAALLISNITVRNEETKRNQFNYSILIIKKKKNRNN